MLIRDADAAMYRAKEQGRARCELFDAEMRARALRRLEVERELRQAIERDELGLHYQPVVALASGEITGARGAGPLGAPRARPARPGRVHPDRRGKRPDRADRALGPGERLPADPRVARAAPRRAARSTSRSTSPPARSPTATSPPRSPRSSPAPASTRSTCGSRSPRASWSRSRRRARATLEALSELGVRLVLDDFGTGYSSLAYLNRFPLDALKIDRSFVDALGVEQERTAIVEAIIGMARALSLDVIAEGVENEAQLSELRRLGCDYAQGHLFSRALPPEKITRLLGEGMPALFGDLARQVGVAEHFGGGGQRGDQAVVPHPADEACPTRRGFIDSCSRASSGSVAFDLGSRSASGRGRGWLRAALRGRLPGSSTAAAGAAREGGEEEADRLRVFFEPLALGDQDQLVVGRHAELVDRGDDRVLAACRAGRRPRRCCSRRASPAPGRRPAPAAARSRR